MLVSDAYSSEQDPAHIGHLVFGQVVKARLDYDAYLVCLTSGRLAILPRALQDRPYKVGDTLAAAVSGLSHEGKQLLLSQRSVHYYRRVSELILAPLLQARQAAIRKVASAEGAPFVKIAIEPASPEAMTACLERRAEFEPYLRLSVVLVQYHADLARYIESALRPAPPQKIRRIVVLPTTREARVEVEEASVPAFLGWKGLNVAVANKLVNRHIVIQGV